MKKTYLLLLVWMIIPFIINAQSEAEFAIRGKIINKSDNEALPGAIIKVLDKEIAAVADEKGEFQLKLDHGEHRLVVSYIGFITVEYSLSVPNEGSVVILMENREIDIEQFDLVSTGYQELSTQTATGSFVKINQEMVDRRISTNILDRLEDITPGLIFNRNGPSDDVLSIRGRSTIFANTMPLIIIDRIPFDGPLESINPNDVESITVLKDAAAASIWGARAGNGVIVITTKSGSYNQGARISFNSNMTIGERQDYHYLPLMGISDFIDIEKSLFERGYYNNRINNITRPVLSPVVETLLAARNGTISPDQADAQLNQFRNNDFRSELYDHYSRNSVFEQYALNLNGGTENFRYVFSTGFDNNRSNTIGNQMQRITLNNKNSWNLFNDKVEFYTGLYFSRQKSFQDTEIPNTHPYESLTDHNGSPAMIVAGFTDRFKNQFTDSGLLDWDFRPLEERGMLDNRTISNDLRVNTGIVYFPTRDLSLRADYQYWNNSSDTRNRTPQEAFQLRNMINSYSSIDDDGLIRRPVPLGDRLFVQNGTNYSHTIRLQADHSTLIGNDHRIESIAGFELKNQMGLSSGSFFYGYDDRIGISTPVDFVNRFPQLYSQIYQFSIPSGISHSGMIDRFVSYFANTTYTFRKKLILTASARKDKSNIFGVETNQKGVPLWSSGLGWIISEESFFKSTKIDFLKARLTYGYNGNVDKTVSAYPTAMYFTSNPIIPNLRYAQISNPPNPELRWEKIGIWNFAVDFASSKNRWSGSLEFYRKEGTDLIGNFLTPAYIGVGQMRGNFATTETMGIDFVLQTKIINKQSFQWNSNFFYSHINEKVTQYDINSHVISYLNSATSAFLAPLAGKPLFSVYSLDWAGLDPNTGDPLGILENIPSNNYSRIISETTPENLIHHGASRPTHFGAFRNDLRIKDFSISFNISYRLGYYFRRSSVNFANLSRGIIDHADYANRWQTPGDELITYIPSEPANLNVQRNTFYSNSSILVDRADNIRFQDIRLSYSLSNTKFKRLPFERIETYVYANNLGIIWKYTNDIIDPDFRSMRPLKTLAVGLKVDF
jgi:TonB-dependent starch-binding outer membrane protein SusC